PPGNYGSSAVFPPCRSTLAGCVSQTPVECKAAAPVAEVRCRSFWICRRRPALQDVFESDRIFLPCSSSMPQQRSPNANYNNNENLKTVENSCFYSVMNARQCQNLRTNA